MKKIIAAIDAMHFSEEDMMNFQYIAHQAEGDLKVIFLEDIVARDVYLANAYPEGGAPDYDKIYDGIRQEQEKVQRENLERFYRFCDNSHMNITLHETTGSPVSEMVTESRFADLLLINYNTSFARLFESNPPKFVKDVLTEAKCPVMVLPDKMPMFKELMFAYNGTFSSMYAIRQFTLLFPQLLNMPVNVVYVKEEKNDTIPHEKLLKEYMAHHYSNVEYTVLNGEAHAAFLGLLMRRNDCIAAFGAYGRSGLSRFFHPSEAESILRTVNAPIFITHP